MEVNTEAALSELQAAESDQGATEATASQQQAETDLYEFMLGDQQIKIPLSHELPIKHNGQVQNVPFEKLLNGFRQSSHLESKQREYKQQLADYEATKAKLEKFGPYADKMAAIQQWSEQNPQEWDALWNMYENRSTYMQNQGQDNPLVAELSTVKQQLAELAQFKQTFEQQQEERATQEDVQAINSEIEDFKKSYPDLKLDEKDLDGVPLEARIIKHGIDRGYPDFTSAALTYKFEDGTTLLAKLRETAEHRGRNETVKALKQDKANGILSRGIPGTGQSSTIDPRRLSEQELRDTALSELNQLLSR